MNGKPWGHGSLERQASRDTGVHHSGRVRHDATPLEMTETVHERANRPLHSCSHRERHEPKSWAQDPAVARVAASAALEA